MLTLKNDIATEYITPFKTVMVVAPADIRNVPVTTIPALLLSSNTAVTFRTEFHELLSRSSTFTVCWDEAEFKEELAELLLHAMFCSDYMSRNNRPVVVVRERAGQRRREDLRSALSQAIISQGFEGVEILSESRSQQNSSYFAGISRFISSETALTEDWFRENLFNDLRSLSGYLVIDTDDISRSSGIHQRLDDVTRSFLLEQPVIAASLSHYLAMEDAFSKISSQNKQLTERLAGAEKTISVIRTKYKDDYENLFKWYHNEYEILPLWYKRFGHILKVLMGKRTFRSLFSDDVKKYKN